MTAGPTERARRGSMRGSLLVAAALFIAYAICAPRGVFWGDSAELAMRSVSRPLAVDGRAYPLFAMIVRALTFVVRDAGWAANLTSALCGAAAVGAVHHLAWARLGLGPSAALGAALSLAVAHTFWTTSVVAEVYGLHVLFVVLIASSALHARVAPVRAAWTMGLTLGAAALHHRLMVFSAPVAIVALFAFAAPSERRGTASALIKGALLGLLPFVVLGALDARRVHAEGGALAAWFDRVLVGTPANATYFLSGAGKSLSSSILYVAKWATFNFVGPSLALAALGMWCGARVVGRGALMLIVAFGAANLLFPVRFGWTGDQYSFLVPAYPSVALLAGVGIEYLCRRRTLRFARASMALAVVCPIAFYSVLGSTAARRSLLPAFTDEASAVFLLPVHTMRPTAASTVRPRLEGVGADGRLFCEWGDGAVYRYLQDVEEIRTDVRVDRRIPGRAEIRRRDWAPCHISVLPAWREPEARLGDLASVAQPGDGGSYLITRNALDGE